GGGAVRLASELEPDVALMDIRMPELDGLAATRAIVEDERLAGVRIVILTTFGLDEYVFEAIRSGASGFLVKDTEPEELIHAVRVVAAGEALLSPSVTKRPRARDRGRRGGGPVEPGDRRTAVPESRHGEDAREPGDEQARRSGPRPTRGDRLRVRPRPPRLAGVGDVPSRRSSRHGGQTSSSGATRSPKTSSCSIGSPTGHRNRR